jgi:hypothetical protein
VQKHLVKGADGKVIEILIVSCQIQGSILISHKREKFWKILTTKHIIPQVMPKKAGFTILNINLCHVFELG